MKTALDLLAERYSEHGGHDFTDLWNAAEKLTEELIQLLSIVNCPNCDGSGGVPVKIRDREYITREMALDAQCPEMEGTIYCDEEWEQEECQWCAERKRLLG